MNIIIKEKSEVIPLVKRMVFLAYKACGGSMGMGVIQEMRLGGKPAEEEQVWKCAYNEEDYPGARHSDQNEVYCDYVFGRMMKWGCKWDKNIIEIRDMQFRGDYQSFCRQYPDNKSLVLAALESLGFKNYEIVEEKKGEPI